jgi:type IV pilus assembly protein PilA
LIRKQARGGIRHGEKGFTLIEMLLVIAILGIIALIAVPNFVSLTERGQTEACAAEEQLIKTITIAYANANGVCPTGIEDLEPYLENPEDIMGSYSFGGSYPDCTATQTSCP